MNTKILVTDGHLKAALSAARSLGRHGFEVHTTQSRPGQTLCSLSVFTKKVHFLPPYESAEEFDAKLVEILKRESFDYLLPASDGALKRISENRRAIQEWTRIDLPPEESVTAVTAKAGLLELAE